MAVTYGQVGTACPQCGSPAAVHSIEELAQLARAGSGSSQEASRRRGAFPAGLRGPAAAGLLRDARVRAAAAAGVLGRQRARLRAAATPRATRRLAGRRPSIGGRSGGMDLNTGDSVADDIAGAVLGAAAGAAAKFIGRSIGKKMQNAYQQKVVPALAAKQEEMLRAQIAIAERHPDLRACLNDNVTFLAGGSRVLPMPNLQTITVEQADALVAQLRNG